MKGMRKVFLGVFYMVACTGMDTLCIMNMQGAISLNSLSGLAALNTSLATGLGVIVWGNVQSHRAANGNGT